MAVSNTKSSPKKFVRCLRIEYKYTDLELSLDMTQVNYVDDVDDLPDYFDKLNTENFIIDHQHYVHCRINPSFKITTVQLSERLYNKYFHVQPLLKK